MAVPHPIPYQGSKRALASAIISAFPEHIDTLYEPFAGSAAVSLACAYRGKANHFVLSDLHKPLITLWDEIIHRPDGIADAYKKLWEAQSGRERDFYDYVRLQFNKTHRPDYFLYLLARCVKASVRYNSDGEFNQSPDNRRRGTQPDTMREHIIGASRLLAGKTSLASADYRQIIRDAHPNDLVYMDPPYQGVSNNRDPRYIGGLLFSDFVEALDMLNKKDVPFIVSYDGRTGSKQYGKPLPSFLNLMRIEIDAGRSSQATLLGRNANTFESLYLSPALISKSSSVVVTGPKYRQAQLSLFEV